ncbi:D-aspartate oxidase [Melipona quadrifasciata]|uniref:D-aspartate oxidase n=1 Tax=Melipona quadrifasciata TaxID=166423 RepID=A0A0M8ZS01_9HYME|nr:D-aspartate oxidase [Melipona quadrifasciata]
MRVTVVGAGVIGMTSALAVKTNFPQFEVHVISDKFSPDTTADGSAGLWSPYLLGNTPCDKILQWGGITHRWLEKFWKAGLAPEIGLSLIPVYRVTSDPNGFPDVSTWTETVYGARKLSSSELEKLNAECTTSYKHGWMFLTYAVEPVRLLPWLTRQFLEAGGKLRNRKIHTLNELIDDDGYDLIINCTGLGARELAGDNTVKCIRGQVARVRAPWVMHAYLADDDDGNYIIPNTDRVVLGGTHQENDFDRTPRKEDCEFIYTGCHRILPGLKNAEVTKEWVGLRPGRHQVRIEAEVCKSPKGREVTVIHNYGHGGSGVTLCWGSAMNVVNIVENLMNLKSNL